MVSERRTLGERLKRQRERRGVSLQDISKQTKIAVALFAGLERGDCSRWPAGLYSRAYVRAYAQAIGLNPDETVEDFVAAFGASLPDGLEGTPAPNPRANGGLRLALVDEPAVDPLRLLRRAAMAATEITLAAGAAGLAWYFLDAHLLATVGSALGYQGVSRMVSDEPLPWWMLRRLRSAGVRPARVEEPTEVAVGDTASTTA